MQSALYQTTGAYGLPIFLFVTGLLGAAAAAATGRALAQTWRPASLMLAAGALLAAATRFLQFALFQQPLLAPFNFLVDFALLVAVGLVSYRLARSRQRAGQYPWLYGADRRR